MFLVPETPRPRHPPQQTHGDNQAVRIHFTAACITDLGCSIGTYWIHSSTTSVGEPNLLLRSANK